MLEDFESVATALSRSGVANSRVELSAWDCQLMKLIRQRAMSKTDLSPGEVFVPASSSRLMMLL
jgi:hypothetical protein